MSHDNYLYVPILRSITIPNDCQFIDSKIEQISGHNAQQKFLQVLIVSF